MGHSDSTPATWTLFQDRSTSCLTAGRTETFFFFFNHTVSERTTVGAPGKSLEE